jgi:hypothetical protein
LTKNPRQDTPPKATRTASASNGSTRLFDISQDSTPQMGYQLQLSVVALPAF